MKEIINSLSGNIITLDLNADYKEFLLSNMKINNLYELGGSGSSKGFSLFQKNVSVNDFKKYFKRKNINYFIGKNENIIKYKKTLVRDILISTNDKAYIIGKIKKHDLNMLEMIIKRYTTSYSIKEKNNEYIIEIDCSKIKNSFIKNKIYYLKDTIFEIKEFISELLLN